ncbi:MAG: hypothetical protein FWD88_07415, partial [Treponema sp.]|nr:hypothetical protein [Treponema sp.]
TTGSISHTGLLVITGTNVASGGTIQVTVRAREVNNTQNVSNAAAGTANTPLTLIGGTRQVTVTVP